MNAGDSNRSATPKPPRGSASDDIAGYMPGHDVEVDDEEEQLPASGPDVDFTKIEWDVSARDTDGKSGTDVVNEFAKRLPNAPGVYRMMNAAGDVLYAEPLEGKPGQYRLRQLPEISGALVATGSTQVSTRNLPPNCGPNLAITPVAGSTGPGEHIDASRLQVTIQIEIRACHLRRVCRPAVGGRFNALRNRRALAVIR